MTIKEAREQKGMTQVQLSVASGVGLSTIQRIENGKIEVTSVSNLLKVCGALECDPCLFLCEK